MNILILILQFSLVSSANMKDNMNDEKWKAHATIVEDGKGVRVATPQRMGSFVAADGDFGFSFEKKSNNMGVCRLRLKFVCDYGLEFQKELKNSEVSLLIDGTRFNTKTDLAGIMDGSFDCSSKYPEMNANLNVKKHQLKFALKDSPKVIKIPEKECR